MTHTKSLAIFISIVLVFLALSGCGSPQPDEGKQEFSSTRNRKPGAAIIFSQTQLKIDGDLKSFKPVWETRELEKGVHMATLTLNSPEPSTPPHFTLKWTSPSVDIHGFWTPNISQNRSNYYGARLDTYAVRYAPVVALYNSADWNRITFAVSDTLNNLTIGTYLKEEDVNFHHFIEFFKKKTPAIKQYRVTLRVDTRTLNYAKVLNDVSQWWAVLPNHKPVPVPEAAKQPMYSTWYSFHQNITADEVVHQCKLSRKLGFKAVIVDDGWQTMDSKRGYAFTGDWLPERIGNMKEFVQRVHQLDMKFLLWYSVPLVGENSINYKKFKGKYLWYWNGQGAYVLDPRFPEVRRFIINTYIDALNNWKLDGFKLDFIGMFRQGDNTVYTASGGRDFASINKAVDRLMTDIMNELRQIKADIMIEFRQPYIGPLMRKYGNMFRAADCPNMALVNRVRTANIRLLSGKTAVHSDMFVWHDNEPPEVAALQILNILYSVPQLSVKLDNFSPLHNKMIKFWINYWQQNRALLLEGTFLPESPQSNFPVIRGHLGNRTIITVFNQRVVRLNNPEFKHIDVVNAKTSQEVVVDFQYDPGKAVLEVFDCMGNLEEKRNITILRGVFKQRVPFSGLLKIRPVSLEP